jgi:hypothetical protein
MEETIGASVGEENGSSKQDPPVKEPMTMQEECEYLLSLEKEECPDGNVDELFFKHAINPFLDDADLIYAKYKKDQNWLSMATALWRSYVSRFGFESGFGIGMTEAKRFFSYYFDQSFNHLLAIPEEEANRWLRDLLVRVKSQMAIERATSLGKNDELFMYDLFIELIRIKLDLWESRLEAFNHKQKKSDSDSNGNLPIVAVSPPVDHTRQNISARGYIRRNLIKPDHGTKEAHIKRIYRDWIDEWRTELIKENGEVWMSQNIDNLLDYKAFRNYFYVLQKVMTRS